MYRQHWSVQGSPFADRPDPDCYYAGFGHDEAMSRVLYCIEEQHGVAVITGAAGCGKSLLLTILEQGLGRTRRTVCRLGAIGEGGLIDDLTRRLLPSDEDRSHRRLYEELATRSEAAMHTVVLIDDVDRTPSFAREASSLIRLLEQFSARMTAVVSAANAEALPTSLTAGRLKIEVGPLAAHEIEPYVRQQLGDDANGEIFTPEGYRVIAELSGRVPRTINSLCELALIIGANRRALAIDGEIVEAAAKELRLSVTSHESAKQPASPSPVSEQRRVFVN
ncbi:ExeA family protein [Stratiformator vulcanicus]|uniref:ORC1/DEAH AAA+ ATPase domain-containing protein n=1 Tax=Stratiformator vulcanicus TaxID=2527980 RepID=A0A517R4G3_9PLAN|nr:AAA family ATPase [Stratiformator vulcanicus]QDT38768.1 hypothetical protein Pan189_31660 [Stratiformator vulcanicus]